MSINLSSAISQVEGSKRFWDQAAPNLTPQEDIQGLGVGVLDITKSFDEVIVLMGALNRAEDIDGVVWSQYRNTFESVPNAMHQFFSAHWNNPSQVLSNVASICSWLWSLKSALLQLLPIHPESERLSPEFGRAMTARIHEAQGWISRAGEIKDVIQQTETSAADLIEQIEGQQNAANEKVQAIQSLRSGPANLHSAISGNSGHDAGLEEAWREGVFDGQEIGAAHPPHPQSGIQGTRGAGGAARRPHHG